jgi:hypothetical protein
LDFVIFWYSENEKTTFGKPDPLLSLGEEGGGTCSVGSLRKRQPQLLDEFLTHCVFIVFRIPDDGQSPKNPVILNPQCVLLM